MKKISLSIFVFILFVSTAFPADNGRAQEAAEKTNEYFEVYEEELLSDELVQAGSLVDLASAVVVLRYRDGRVVYSRLHVGEGGSLHIDGAVQSFPPVDNKDGNRAAVDIPLVEE